MRYASEATLVLPFEKVLLYIGLTTSQTYSTMKSSTTMPIKLESLISVQDSKRIDT